MTKAAKQTIEAWTIVIVAVIIGLIVGYSIGNDPSLDDLESKIKVLQLQANEVNAQCIQELEARDRMLNREFNMFNSTAPTNGV